MSDTSTRAMVVVPPAIDSDAEDVVWALQTAEALWKRNERVDAIVWVRRAAQAAGEAEDDDRALVLARNAAELADWLANHGDASASTASSAPPAAENDGIDALLREMPAAGANEVPEPPSSMPVSIDVEDVPSAPASPPVSDPVPSLASQLEPEAPHAASPHAAEPPSSPPDAPALAADDTPALEVGAMTSMAPMADDEAPTPLIPPVAPAAALPPVAEVAESTPSPRSAREDVPAPTAEEAHAGMLDPWAEHGEEQETKPRVAPAPPPASVLAPAPAPLPLPRAAAKPPPPPPPRPKGPPPPPPAKRAAVAAAEPAPPPAPTPSIPPSLNLADVEAFADLPDDARDAFAAAATITKLAIDEEVSQFALVFVMEGEVDVSATIVDAPAIRLEKGAVLRNRGTLDEHPVALRLIGASDDTRIATWGDEAVEQAFRTIPWVEDDLRAAGDKVQAMAGMTMGPLGERLDADLREGVTNKLSLRALAEGEVFAEQGKPIPGFLVVGAGELEIVKDGAVTGRVRSGDFLFASDVLGGGAAPATARAGKGGALVMVADRKVAQELMVTCPPLLEIFAGM